MSDLGEELSGALVENNLAHLHAELDWLTQVIEQVICTYLKQQGHEQKWQDIPLPDLTKLNSRYADLVSDWRINKFERLALALTLAPHLRPELLDVFFGLNAIYNRTFTEFGGVTDKTFNGFLPTAQTLKFLICGNAPFSYGKLMAVLAPSNRLMAEQMLVLDSVASNQPAISGQLYLSQQWLHYLITGDKVGSKLRADFPARLITTQLDWTELVLDSSLMSQIQQIKNWLTYGDTLMNEWGLSKKIKPGYRALFFGPPGTGKTLTASLLAKSSGREVYRVDLSLILSKYIGETEKNLTRIFDIARYKNWILFFDEADSLFGKRSAATSSNDGHAKQQTGYLLQRIEDFPGIIILATNRKPNMDEAFISRFQGVLHFTTPNVEQRLQLWQNAFSGSFELDDEVDLPTLAEDYELTGAAIINVLRFCAMSAISRGSMSVSYDEILEGIRYELRKENNTLL